MKKFTKTALVAVFCLTAGYTAYDSQNKNEKLSDVMLENVEALAGGESSVNIPCCYEKDRTCSFNMVGKDGTTGSGTVGDAKSC